jgi:hypothetical protein
MDRDDLSSQNTQPKVKPMDRDNLSSLKLVLAQWLTTYAPATKKRLDQAVCGIHSEPRQQTNTHPIQIESFAGTIIFKEELDLDMTIASLRKHLVDNDCGNSMNNIQFFCGYKPIKYTDSLRSVLENIKKNNQGINTDTLTLRAASCQIQSSLNTYYAWKGITSWLEVNDITINGISINSNTLCSYDDSKANTLFNQWMESRTDLDRIKIFGISFSKFTQLPESIRKLRKLEELNLTESGISSLQYIEDLPELKHLYLSETPIKALPESIEKLQKLEILDLSKTGIEALPESILTLKELKSIDINDLDLNPRALQIISILKEKGVTVHR